MRLVWFEVDGARMPPQPHGPPREVRDDGQRTLSRDRGEDDRGRLCWIGTAFRSERDGHAVAGRLGDDFPEWHSHTGLSGSVDGSETASSLKIYGKVKA